MSVVYILLPLGLILSGTAIVAFLWALRRGQLDDMQTPAVRILFDDEPAQTETSPQAPPKTAL